MARRATYKENHESFGAFILSERMRDVTAEVAQDIARLARQLAPRRRRGVVPDGAAMADQFRVNREAGTFRIDKYTRVKVEVFNSARSAAFNEFGVRDATAGEDGDTTRNKRHRMLGRAGAAFGDFKPDESWLL